MADKSEKVAKVAGKDDKTTSRPTSPAPPAAASSLVVPTVQPSPAQQGETRNTRSRSGSPTGLSTELLCKSRSQISRVQSLRKIEGKLPESASKTSLDEVQAFLAQVDELHKTFCKEHSYLEVTWPAAHLDHEYFAQDYFEQEIDVIFDLRRRLHQLKSELTAQNPVPMTRSAPAKLPDIKLPTFSGNYLDWSAYSELFSSLIIDNDGISNIEKLHYLRSSLSEEPLKLISGFPLSGDSFTLSWESLKHRYENKRVILQSQLDKLFSISPVTQKNAKELRRIAAHLRDTSSSLLTLGNHEELWNSMLVHLISRNLDKVTREAWETSLGSSSEYPSADKLEALLTAKASALERIEATPPAQTQAPQKRAGQRPSLAAVTVPNRVETRIVAHQYPCDKCQGDHFIVSCSQFREMSVPDRRRLIERLTLCKNCCSRHTTANCKSPHRCKFCGAAHHSLLHLAKPQSTPAHPKPSTSASPAH